MARKRNSYDGTVDPNCSELGTAKTPPVTVPIFVKLPVIIRRITMQKYLVAVIVIVASTIVAAQTGKLALDANGNTAKIFIPNIEDRFNIQEHPRMSILRYAVNREQAMRYFKARYIGAR